MKLIAPTHDQTARWEAGWATRPGFSTTAQRARFRHWQVSALSSDDETVGIMALCAGIPGSPDAGMIADIWIQPDHRGRGHARLARRLGEAWCAEHDLNTIRVAVGTQDPAAIALFAEYPAVARHMVLPVREPAPLPSDISAVPMDPAGFHDWKDRGVRGYAEQSSGGDQLDPEAALDQARVVFDQLLPNGLNTPGHELLDIRAAGTLVAQLWVFHNPDESETFIYNVATETSHRGKGYGRAAMLVAQHRAAAMGLPRIRLNVFDGNTVANQMYRKLGYRTITEFRSKHLT